MSSKKSPKRSRDRSPESHLTVEDLLEQIGGFGLFQWGTTICLFFNKFMTGWSMFQMAFAGLIPGWTCQGPPGSDPQNWTFKGCNVMVNSSGQSEEEACYAYNFTGDKHTAIREWSLVCDLDWVKSAVTSIQMGGLLLGALLAGQMGDAWGRRKTTYLFVLEHSVLNIITAFSTSWQMFAVCRFFIGFGVGGILVTAFTLGMEFLPTRWRAVCASLPVWALGVSMFALTAWRLQEWSTLHLVCGVCGLPAVLGYYFVPESPRWLTVKGRLDQAEDVIARIARVNGKPVPVETMEVLQDVAHKERELHESSSHYTYLDIFRDLSTAKITLIFCFEWFSFSLIFYGISFGISALAGNIYLNIFLMDALVVPFLIAVFFTSNWFGRKLTAFPLLFIACAAALACLALRQLEDKDTKFGGYITALSLTAKTGVGAGWAVLQTWGTEIYPTVTRNLGYGAANTAARVGGILAPYVIDFDNYMVVSYIVIGCLLFVDTILLLLLPETRGTPLQDSLRRRLPEDSDDTEDDEFSRGSLPGPRKEKIAPVLEPPVLAREAGAVKQGAKETDTVKQGAREADTVKQGARETDPVKQGAGEGYGSTDQLTRDREFGVSDSGGEGAPGQLNEAFSNDEAVVAVGSADDMPGHVTRL